MNTDLVGLAFAAGMVAAFNPCGFAMLPAYLTLVIQRDGGGTIVALGRALIATAAMAVGFVAVFGLFGVLTVSAASTVQRHLPYVTVALGIALVVVGIWLLMGGELPGWPIGTRSLDTRANWAPTSRLGSMVGYGVGYALASLSCTVGPFLAVTGSGLRGGSVLAVVPVYLAYAAGIALVVGVLAVAVALASAAVIDRMRRVLPYINLLSGAILVPVGLYVAYYGGFELRLFDGSGDPDDPVIGTAGRIQGALMTWVARYGSLPWLAALCAVAIGVLAGRARRRRRASDGAITRLDSAP